MKIAVFHGSPRRGNTYRATKTFMEELSKNPGVEYTEFQLPSALPEFCVGCQRCLGSTNDNCPHFRYVSPIYAAIISADALIFTTPHYGASDMSAGLKNLLDHLDFFTLTIAPREEMFSKKAFIITTSSGSAAAITPIRRYLKNWGVNRVHSLGIRMFTNEWNAMPQKKQRKLEETLRKNANKFYRAKKRRPYISTVFMYYMSIFILKRYIKPGAYPYEYWKEKGYFSKRPF